MIPIVFVFFRENMCTNVLFPHHGSGKSLYFKGNYYLEPQTAIYKWLFQLDDEPNLYVENDWKSPFPSIYKWLALGFQLLEGAHFFTAPGSLGGRVPFPQAATPSASREFVGFAGG